MHFIRRSCRFDRSRSDVFEPLYISAILVIRPVDLLRQGWRTFFIEGAHIVEIFGEVLSRAHGNFEQQNGVLESCIIVINCYIIGYIIFMLIYYYYCYCKNDYWKRENKIMERNLRKPV
jgi:hypothetical protein